MDHSLSVLFLLFAGIAAANFPFVTTRFLGLFGSAPKTLALRLLELVFLYLLVGIIGLLLEKSAGQIAPQGWEFYAITATLFLTFAFPGFVYRYLLKRHG